MVSQVLDSSLKLFTTIAPSQTKCADLTIKSTRREKNLELKTLANMFFIFFYIRNLYVAYMFLLYSFKLLYNTYYFPINMLSYPADLSKYYALILVDVADNTLHWMIVNIPGKQELFKYKQ